MPLVSAATESYCPNTHFNPVGFTGTRQGFFIKGGKQSYGTLPHSLVLLNQ